MCVTVAVIVVKRETVIAGKNDLQAELINTLSTTPKVSTALGVDPGEDSAVVDGVSRPSSAGGDTVLSMLSPCVTVPGVAVG